MAGTGAAKWMRFGGSFVESVESAGNIPFVSENIMRDSSYRRVKVVIAVLFAAALLAGMLALPIRAQRASSAIVKSLIGQTGSAGSLDITPGSYSGLEFRFIGPLGNRVASVAGVAGNPLVYYAGAASGGIFKTTDGGVTWRPVFDREPVSSIGSLAAAPSDPNIVWAGTGESSIRSNISMGWGIYKSTDAGNTWQRMGLENTGRIGRILIDPRDPNTVFACALGNSYGPQPDRGVFRTTDGGQNWQKVLYVDENTGCSDLAISPSNPQILFAGMWQFVIHTWGQRRPRQRHFQIDRRRRHLDSARGTRPARSGSGTGRAGNRAQRRQSHLRNHRNGHGRAFPREADGGGRTLALGRRRRQLANDDSQPRCRRPTALLLPLGRQFGQSR
jgi:hypothetical protein